MAGIERVCNPVDAHQRDALDDSLAARCRADGADRLVAGKNGGASFGRSTVQQHLDAAGARGAAMLHARHHLLADIAALVEIDARKAVHVGLVREGVAICEVDPAPRHAAGDPMGLIVGRIDQFGVDEPGQLLLEFRRRQDAEAELVVARIGEGNGQLRFGLRRKRAVPCGEDAEAIGQIFDHNLGPELVEFHFVGEALGQRLRTVDQETATLVSGRLRDQEIHDDLALWRQQRTESRQPRLQPADISGDEAVEEVARVLAKNLHHAPIGEKRCFHMKISCEVLRRNVSPPDVNDKTREVSRLTG